MDSITVRLEELNREIELITNYEYCIKRRLIAHAKNNTVKA